MGNKIPFESEREMRMRQRVSAFTGDPETIAEMSGEEIEAAVRMAFREIYAFIREDDANPN